MHFAVFVHILIVGFYVPSYEREGFCGGGVREIVEGDAKCRGDIQGYIIAFGGDGYRELHGFVASSVIKVYFYDDTVEGGAIQRFGLDGEGDWVSGKKGTRREINFLCHVILSF